MCPGLGFLFRLLGFSGTRRRLSRARGSELIKYGVASAGSFGRESFRFRAGSAGPINTERLERRLGVRVRTLTFTP